MHQSTQAKRTAPERKVLDRLGRRRVKGIAAGTLKAIGAILLHLWPDDEDKKQDGNDSQAANDATDDGAHRGTVTVVVAA